MAEAEAEEVKEEPKLPEPNFTLYVNNIDERIPKDGAFMLKQASIPVLRTESRVFPPSAELKKTLKAVFSKWGAVQGVYVSKALKLRGQAWVIFDSIDAAQLALDELDGFPLNDKPVVRFENPGLRGWSPNLLLAASSHSALYPPRRKSNSRTRGPT